MKSIALAGMLLVFAGCAVADPTYHDPISQPGITFHNAGAAAGNWVDYLPDPFSTGVVKLGYWVFSMQDDPGNYFAYRFMNINAGGLGGPALIDLMELDDLATHLDLGDGGAPGRLWTYEGDYTTRAIWTGHPIQISSGGLAIDGVKMYELYSLAPYGERPALLHPSGGGPWTGAAEIWGPVPEPGFPVAGLMALAWVALRLRRR